MHDAGGFLAAGGGSESCFRTHPVGASIPRETPWNLADRTQRAAQYAGKSLCGQALGR